MRLTKEDIGALRARLVAVREQARSYFVEADPESVVDEAAWPPRESWEVSEIETSEFLIADLTHERQNVYYEIGHPSRGTTTSPVSGSVPSSPGPAHSSSSAAASRRREPQTGTSAQPT